MAVPLCDSMALTITLCSGSAIQVEIKRAAAQAWRKLSATNKTDEATLRAAFAKIDIHGDGSVNETDVRKVEQDLRELRTLSRWICMA